MATQWTVKIDDEGISICKGERVAVYWDRSEWVEDPNVVFSIAHAIAAISTDTEVLYALLAKDS